MGRSVQAYNGQGKCTCEAGYDIYGGLRNIEGGKGFIPFRQAGQYEDNETGLYYNRFRYYSPQTGSYLSKDPIGLDGNNPNTYAYVHDSNMESDPSGLSRIPMDDALTELAKSSPISIPSDARVQVKPKAGGYDQVSYKWKGADGNYEARWHTATPNAPKGTPPNWRVSKKIPGNGGIQPINLEMIKGNNGVEWASAKSFKEASDRWRLGTATDADKDLLKRGHFDAEGTHFDMSKYN
ncbi:RHS repeat-associated core domain-containing protein [Apibacter raozihei]|uniref:RHS repeat-associated core domain-containing protein n=1 Tax=Apibacter raozihei TaxID=2500547 RepID=UPI000FE3E5CF|nr:RHS repeat-associated core domain-containing protein [Apibacter raozihei]